MSALTIDPLTSLKRVRHGFMTREGGVSEGIYASLNCGYGSADDRARVTENRRRAAAALSLPADALVLESVYASFAKAVENRLVMRLGPIGAFLTPLLTHQVKIDLPQATTQKSTEKPEIVTVAIDGSGTTFWNNNPITRAELGERLAIAARQQPQPELHLRADKQTQYQKLAEVMAAAQNAGVRRMGFVTSPQSGN